MKKLFLPAIMTLLLFSCDGDKKTAISPDLLKAESLHYSSSWKDCNTEEEGCASIEFNYLKFTNVPFKEKINDYILNSMLSNYIGDSVPVDFKELETAYYTDFENAVNDTDEFKPSWEIYESVEVYNTFKNVLCLHFDNYQYLGGAHGIATNRYISFNLETGNVMKFDDFFKKGGKEFVGKLMEDQYRAFMGIPEGDPLNEDGGLFDDYILPNDNFIFRNDSVVFFFNPYEIAAYSYGTSQFGFAKSELNSVLKD